MLVTTRSAGNPPLPPLRVRSAVYTRDMPEVKSVGLFGPLRHRRAAQRAGFDDALCVDDRSALSEGGTWNIGFGLGEQVVWPDAESLAGTTMRLFRQGHASVSTTVEIADVTGFDAAFAANAAIGIRAIGRLDDLPFPETHPLIEELRKEYAELPGDPLQRRHRGIPWSDRRPTAHTETRPPVSVIANRSEGAPRCVRPT
ncbi:aminotransferase class IV [Streptomyces sp. NPDC005774]|uniref:aminotransferase class IV n=1 Tax=Streptomyces sp. NPDC005774 TaxID=3364728 RepID=UPI00369958CA